MLVIPVNKVVDSQRIIRKNGGPRRRRRAQGVSDPLKNAIFVYKLVFDVFRLVRKL
jgi:hypothetical protein